ncbi:hypothetical protein CKA81_01620 [Pollutimonas thiosulfatoxidans]|uniref:Smr domain-containing protein n=2 Tax=Pollutimonas thiosulfatoxidans TaxID=2028345 RepID=A0A410G8P0_9BURK|nr:hypothetical protein CKA81_01620 [Pollutimonas thiosulfatoxidans]
MHNAGWRMPASKRRRGGEPAKSLADLKHLRKLADQAARQAEADQAATDARRAASTGRDSSSKQTLPVAAPNWEATLSPEDVQLFRRSMRTVTRIKDPGRLVLPPVSSATAELLRQRRARALGQQADPLPTVSDLFSPGSLDTDDTRFLRSGHGPDLIKGLKRGKWPVGATLDLHGNTLDEARDRLDGFLQSCLTHHIKCVRIVHGKGYGSRDGQPVLKQTLRRWLTQFSFVVAYIESGEHDGGAGAVDVLLKSAERNP